MANEYILKDGEWDNLVERLQARMPDHGYRGIDVAEGWYSLLDHIDTELRAIDPDYQILQVKEKFGSLRFYFTSTDHYQEMAPIVEIAETKSMATCEVCGADGVTDTGQWYVVTLCPEHTKAREEGAYDL